MTRHDPKIPKREKQMMLETLIENAIQNCYNLDVNMYLMEALKIAKEIRRNE
jgi:hypothetical protein